jgi:hypothetical protein
MNADRSDDDLALLRATLANAGVEIRSEDCEGEGGLVRINDRVIVFVPLGSSKAHQQTLYIDSIKKLAVSLDYIPPRIRQLLGEEDWNG